MKKYFAKGVCSLLLLSFIVLCMPFTVKAAENFDAANMYLTQDKKNDFLPGTCADYQLNLDECTSMTVKGYSKVHIPKHQKEDSYIYRVTNTSKNKNKYAIYKNGAQSMDVDEKGEREKLDVKVYYWLEKVNSNTNLNDYHCGFTDTIGGPGNGYVYIQFDNTKFSVLK